MTKKRRFDYQEISTDISGLKFLPTIPGQDDQDWIKTGYINDCLVDMDYKHQNIFPEFSDLDKDVVSLWANKLISQNMLNSILEIGVNKSGEHSSTMHLLKMKPKNTKYLGVDLNPKNLGSIINPETNCFALCENSSNIVNVMQYAHSIGIDNIDLLLIDGFHSINQVAKDWLYTEYLSKGGVVLFHDSNYHPGPYCIFNAIDEKLYNKIKYYENEEFDWGIAAAERK
jgi:hypothetical protein